MFQGSNYFSNDVLIIQYSTLIYGYCSYIYSIKLVCVTTEYLKISVKGSINNFLQKTLDNDLNLYFFEKQIDIWAIESYP